MFNFVYANGHLSEVGGIVPPTYDVGTGAYAFDLPGAFPGLGYLFSSYTTPTLFLDLRNLYVSEHPGANAQSVDAAGSNQVGQTVGTYGLTGWINTNGFFDQFSVGFGTEARSVNNLGDIAGICDCGVGTVGFLYDHGSVTYLSYPGALVTEAFGINDSGLVVGDFYRTTWGGPTPFYWDGAYHLIPGAYYGSIVGVTNDGAMVGWGSAPVPEPGTWVLLLLGFATCAVCRLLASRVSARRRAV